MDRCQVVIRPATAADAPIVVQYLRSMLHELAAMGGHPVSGETEWWAHLQDELQGDIREPSKLYLLAETVGMAPAPVGWAYARITDREAVYQPGRVLHISALFVPQPYRKEGIGQALLEVLIEWGRDSECVEAELNVLVNNPARALYERLGFSTSQVKMALQL